MEKHSCSGLFAALALFLILSVSALAQSSSAKTTLVVNGHTAEGAVLQIDGHPYVDVEKFAQMINAAVSFEPGRVLLTIPPAEAGAKPDHPATGLSKDFAKAGISQLAVMWEWKGAISSAIRSGVAGGNWLAPLLHDHRVRAEESQSKTSLAAKTESDQKALQLLKNELASLAEWDSNTQSTIHSLNGEQSVSPTVAENDPLLMKISECGSFLNAMLVTGEFADSSSCH
jgi:hypothetical protein